MTTIRDAVAYARTRPAGRLALAAIWLGAYIATAGLAQLHAELRRNPLPGVKP